MYTECIAENKIWNDPERCVFKELRESFEKNNENGMEVTI